MSVLLVLLIGIALGFLGLFLGPFGLTITIAAVAYLAVMYYRRGQYVRIGLLLAAAGGTYALLLGRIYLTSLTDPAVGMPAISQVAFWAGVLVTGTGVAVTLGALLRPRGR